MAQSAVETGKEENEYEWVNKHAIRTLATLSIWSTQHNVNKLFDSFIWIKVFQLIWFYFDFYEKISLSVCVPAIHLFLSNDFKENENIFNKV